MEGWLVLHLKSAVRWQGNINKDGQNRGNELIDGLWRHTMDK